MSRIINDIVNTVTLVSDSETRDKIIFTEREGALNGVHTALLINLAASAVDQKFSLSNNFSCKYNDLYWGNITIGTRDGKVLIGTPTGEFELTCAEVDTYILEPFSRFTPEFAFSINEHIFSCEGLTCWLLEDLSGYYSGQDSDIWILTSQGMLIATQELHTGDRSSYLSPVAVFDLTHQWTEEEVANSEQIKAIIQASY